MNVPKLKLIIAMACAAFLVCGGIPDLVAQDEQFTEQESSLSVIPDEIDFGILKDTETGTASIEITNIGHGTMRWMVKWVDPWLTLDTYSGIVEGNAQTVTVTADPLNLPLGRHRAEIVITSDSETRTVPISVTVLRDNNDTYKPKLEEIRVDSITTTQVERKIRMSAIGIYSDGSERDITKKVRWISENERIGYFIDKGFFIGKHRGTVNILVKEGSVTSAATTIRIDAPDGPLLRVSLPKIRLDHMVKDSVEDIPLTIRNAGTGELEWEVTSRTPWLLIEGGTAPASKEVIWQTENEGYPESADLGEGEPNTRETGYSSSLRGRGRKTVKISADVAGLSEGKYEGTILVKSDGGEEEIIIPVNILSLKSISITPVSLTMVVNHRMVFRATGIWSDGSRTDLSGRDDGRWIVSDHSVGYFLRSKPLFVAQHVGRTEIRKVMGNVASNLAVVTVEDDSNGSVLMVSQHEVDFGKVGPGETSKGMISLQNVGGEDLIWLLYRMGDWILPYDDTLSGTAGISARHIRLTIESMTDEGVSVNGLFPVRIKFETGHDSVSYEKRLHPGSYREELKILSNGGERTVFLKFDVTEQGSRPSMEVKPLGIDFGSVETDKKLMKRIELRNVGKDVLKWEAVLQGKKKIFKGLALEKGRYVSFENEDIAGKGRYTIPTRLKNSLEISGEWSEEGGYPYSTGEKDLLRYSFSGSGIVVFLWKDVYGGRLDVFVDGQMVGEIDCASEKRERIEFPVIEILDEEPHLLILAVRGGTVEVEGVRIYASGLIEDSKEWMRISPEKGTTTNEVDYINVMASTEGLAPGTYSENILFYSGEGVEKVEVSIDVMSNKTPELIKIYRYIKGTESLLSPETASGDLPLERYQKGEGAFYLFRRGTPGTTEFFQWHNPSMGTHFYSYSRSGGKHSLEGYVFDGTIGNIATVKLPLTRDLYRWFNPDTGAYFYTTDTKGENHEKMGYKYDGVAGYVR